MSDRPRFAVVLTYLGSPHTVLGTFYTPERAQLVGERLWRTCPELASTGWRFAVCELLRPRELVAGA